MTHNIPESLYIWCPRSELSSLKRFSCGSYLRHLKVSTTGLLYNSEWQSVKYGISFCLKWNKSKTLRLSFADCYIRQPTTLCLIWFENTGIVPLPGLKFPIVGRSTINHLQSVFAHDYVLCESPQLYRAFCGLWFHFMTHLLYCVSFHHVHQLDLQQRCKLW